MSYISPFAARLPLNGTPYHDAIPCSTYLPATGPLGTATLTGCFRPHPAITSTDAMISTRTDQKTSGLLRGGFGFKLFGQSGEAGRDAAQNPGSFVACGWFDFLFGDAAQFFEFAVQRAAHLFKVRHEGIASLTFLRIGVLRLGFSRKFFGIIDNAFTGPQRVRAVLAARSIKTVHPQGTRKAPQRNIECRSQIAGAINLTAGVVIFVESFDRVPLQDSDRACAPLAARSSARLQPAAISAAPA
jgi:hypothetical protein